MQIPKYDYNFNNNENLKDIVDIADTNIYETFCKENKVCKNCAVRHLNVLIKYPLIRFIVMLINS